MKLNTGFRLAGKSNFPKAGHPSPHVSGQTAVVWETAESECGITFYLKYNDWKPQSGKFDQMDCFSLKIPRSHYTQLWDVAERGGSCCALSGGAAQCLHILWRAKGICTKQPFSTTSITVNRLCYLQMVIGQTIFIEQFCFYSLSGNFRRP